MITETLGATETLHDVSGMQRPAPLDRLVGMSHKVWISSLLMAALVSACGSTESTSAAVGVKLPGPADIDVVEESTVSISRDPRDEMRFTATFTLENTGGSAGRAKCDLYVGREKARIGPMPILKPGQERYLERSVRVKRAVWEIDGDIVCK